MGKLIFSNQYVFLKGMLLVDGVVAVNELVDLAKCSKKSCLIFKVDFEKAYICYLELPELYADQIWL